MRKIFLLQRGYYALADNRLIFLPEECPASHWAQGDQWPWDHARPGLGEPTIKTNQTTKH